MSPVVLNLGSFLEQRLLALEVRYGRQLRGLDSEKRQLHELVERQSRLVVRLQGELGSSTHNSSVLQRQQAVLSGTVQKLLAMVSQCNGKMSVPLTDLLPTCQNIHQLSGNLNKIGFELS